MKFFSKDGCYDAFRLLKFTFVVAPVLAGLDKFFYLMTDWSQYLAPVVSKVIGYHDHGFMMFAGVVEVVAGIGVYFRPKLFAYVVSLWLLGIILNLLLSGHYYDVALRDLGLCLAALSLGRLSIKYA